MDKDDFLAAGENDVRLPREVPAVQAISVSLRVKQFPYDKLRLRVSGPNRTHDATAAFRGDMVSHGLVVLHAPIKVSLVDEIWDCHPPGKRAVILAACHGFRKSQVPAWFYSYVARIEKPVDINP